MLFSLLTILSSTIAIMLAGLLPQEAPAAPAATQPEVVAEPPAEDAAAGAGLIAAPPIAPEVDALLDRLEASATDLRAFTAEITYIKEEALLERIEKRYGELLYQLDLATDRKRFAALFNRRIVNRRLEEELEHYVFDGRWLAEIDHERKQFIKREIVAPGRELDPLKLGEGPFPLPIGQEKNEVLRRFMVVPFAPHPGHPLEKVAETFETDGLLLVPLPDTPQAEEFRTVELLYDRVTLLPVGINLVETNDDRKTVLLANPRRNPDLSPEQLGKLSIAEPDETEWRIDIRPWSD